MMETKEINKTMQAIKADDMLCSKNMISMNEKTSRKCKMSLGTYGWTPKTDLKKRGIFLHTGVAGCLKN